MHMCKAAFCPPSCSVYSILSAFTLALLEDTGWYQANYAIANRTINNESIPLLYGKGVFVCVCTCVYVCVCVCMCVCVCARAIKCVGCV